MKTLRHLIEAAALAALFSLFRLLPLDAASWLGGWLARKIGPFMNAQQTAEKNLAMVFPEKTDAERKIILRDMWDNLGRTAAEFPWIATDALYQRIHTAGIDHFQPPDKPVVFVSGHIGNWETSYMVVHRRGIPVALAYRQANNPFADKIICSLRATQSSGQFPKGQAGAVRLIRALKNGQSLAMLIDQKMNDGIPIPFFGREAMTAPAVAQFALRYDMPIFMVRVVRTKGAHFNWSMAPLVYEKTGDTDRDIRAIMLAINAQFESWIRECPAQWFWVHKRWPN